MTARIASHGLPGGSAAGCLALAYWALRSLRDGAADKADVKFLVCCVKSARRLSASGLASIDGQVLVRASHVMAQIRWDAGDRQDMRFAVDERGAFAVIDLLRALGVAMSGLSRAALSESWVRALGRQGRA